jgi:nucleotide-binding universal stress UspA family protein
MTKKILCPVDFSKGSERALAKAEELAKELGAEIELLHAYQIPVVALPDAPVSVSPAFVADLTDHAQKELGKLEQALKSHGVSVTTKLIQGSPADTVVARAEELKAYLIVIGTHGRGGFRRFLLGSIAERVVRMATVPVLTVHVPE